ncbi:urea carboxylase [Cytidiella melzeri]|nr:urea carboxylase [Cytidiella melzeri]
MPLDWTRQKLLVANRGEIAVRILRTARRLQIPTLAIYTQCDATSAHVILADEAVPLRTHDIDPASNARGYTDIEEIVEICVKHGVTLVHPGYGFLSENANFAVALQENGVSWVGPRPDIVRCMGLKHEARRIAQKAGVPVVPGEGVLLTGVDEAVEVARTIGYPIVMKATAGGGGMGMMVCTSEDDVKARFDATRERAETLFHDSGLFLERYITAARHVEVQIFGDGQGRVIHMGERECSVQRRYQKVIEEAPSPYMAMNPGVRENLCQAAVHLCESIRYNSAGTVEFVVDDTTGEFFFLEMNTRIQVEHTVTEAICPSLDIVELMLLQAATEQASTTNAILLGKLDRIQQYFAHPMTDAWAIQSRVYCENPDANFKPTPGVLQYVAFPQPLPEWMRIDTWVQTGTTITPFYDPLAAKIVIKGRTRDETLQLMLKALQECKIWGPPNNMAYLRAICEDSIFAEGKATTMYLTNFQFTPRAMDILSGGIETTVQDFPGRRLGIGIPRSGPMDSLALRIANLVVGNSEGTEGLEITLPAAGCRIFFHVAAVICITGASAKVTVNGQEVPMWAKVIVPKSSKLTIGKVHEGTGQGLRTYLAVRGGFPEVPQYLGSKSTSLGLGGYQGRALVAGDQITLGSCTPTEADRALSLPPRLIPSYPEDDWTIYCLSGPHCDEEFITAAGSANFFATRWRVSASSNRMGIRLEGPKIEWARETGGEGGSHPSNIHDNGYALGTVNINGDTPVILGNEGPDMGGYVCLCTVASAEMWKLGQLRPGVTVRFVCVTINAAQKLAYNVSSLLLDVARVMSTSGEELPDGESEIYEVTASSDEHRDPKLKVLEAPGRLRVTFRQAGDAAILVEYGDAKLDLHVRARIHAFEDAVRARNVKGVWALSPCIRSTMVRFDPDIVAQSDVLAVLMDAESSLPVSMRDVTFRGRRITFPIVVDDSWTKDALERYMRTTRDEAVYLPSNIDYLAKNNGLVGGADEALKLLVNSDWLVFGVGFYLGCPFLVPIDPRCRLVGQKMNPSRTYTPRGAVGIAGLVAAIYPIDSPGGYQLYGRTLPPWQTWGRGADFAPDTPWLLRPFDQISFKVITEAEYSEIETQFDAGQYKFTIEPATFSMSDYTAFVESIQPEIDAFRRHQAEGVASEEAREHVLLSRWEQRRRAEREAELAKDPTDVSRSDGEQAETSGFHVTSSVSASVWKLTQRPGYTVKTAEDILLVLEAMKTEINIEAGEENVGRTVQAYAHGVKEGAMVTPGQILVVLS